MLNVLYFSQSLENHEIFSFSVFTQYMYGMIIYYACDIIVEHSSMNNELWILVSKKP